MQLIKVTSLLLLSLGLQQSGAHICILKPEQRGGFNVSASTPGQPSCYKRTGYCGGTAAMAPKADAEFMAGGDASITFEQNLNHWFPPMPGHFDIAISYNVDAPTDDDWMPLKKFDDFPAFEMVMRTVFEVRVTMPSKTTDHAILRFRYVSNNPMEIDPKPNTQAIFYNCVDIKLVASTSANAAPALEETSVTAPAQAPKLVGAGSDYHCATPPTWSATFAEKNMWGDVKHTVAWDAPTKFTRWDKTGILDGTMVENTISCINDYNKPVEYVNFKTPGPDRCPNYGNDKFYDWSYGDSNTKMVYGGRSAEGVDSWSSGGGMYTWTTQDLGKGFCKPLGWTRGLSTFVMTSFTQGKVPAGEFTPDAACTKPNVALRGCHTPNQLNTTTMALV